MKTRKCTYSQSDLLSYLQNRMSCEQESEFQRHLISCPECCRELERLRSLIGSLENRPFSTRTWLIASAIACSVLAGLYIFQHETEQPLPPVHDFHINPQPQHLDIDTTGYDSIKTDRDTVE